MLQSSARLLRLLTLLQSRATWTGGELTSRLEVTARTLRRDVDRLRTLGYPVHSTTGPAGGYALGPGASLPPLMLDNQEGLAVAIALHGGSADVSGVAEAGQRALAKLDQVLPARLRKRLESLRAAIVRVPAPAAPKIELGVVETLAAACFERRVLHLRYRDQQGRATRRTVEPQRLVLAERRWYLAAWDRGREAWRTFRVDRIATPVELGGGFVPRPAPEGGDFAEYVARSTSWTRHPHRARVLFHAPLAVVRAKIPPAYGALTAVAKRQCRLETGGSSLDGIAVWLAVTGHPFEVESPPELAAHLKVLARRLSRAAA
jgi:predicted DNA-binding transcriptional regulator YafY